MDRDKLLLVIYVGFQICMKRNQLYREHVLKEKYYFILHRDKYFSLYNKSILGR